MTGGSRKASADVGSDMGRERRVSDIAFGQCRCSAMRATALGFTVGMLHCVGPAWVDGSFRLLVDLAFMHEDAVTGDEDHHVVFERDKVVRLHSVAYCLRNARAPHSNQQSCRAARGLGYERCISCWINQREGTVWRAAD